MTVNVHCERYAWMQFNIVVTVLIYVIIIIVIMTDVYLSKQQHLS